MFNALQHGGPNGVFEEVDKLQLIRDLIPVYLALYRHGYLLFGKQKDGMLKQMVRGASVVRHVRQGNQLSSAGACVATHQLVVSMQMKW